jgi:uncharacterized protein YjbI with pentapeptide repeats
MEKPMGNTNSDHKYVTVAGERVRLAGQQFRKPDPQSTKQLLGVLKQGSRVWNEWRVANPEVYVDLRGVSLWGKTVLLDGANLAEANLHSAGLSGVSLIGADLSAAVLHGATLQNANLTGARLAGADLSEADLNLANITAADLRGADLSWAGMILVTGDNADFRKTRLEAAYILDASFADAKMQAANLTDAVLRGSAFVNADLSLATLEGANLVETDLTNAKLNGCRVYGASVWKPTLEGTEQRNLIITPSGEHEVTVDNLRVAQFIYLLLENAEIREVIDTTTSKLVLILGRFTSERKQVLDRLKSLLRERAYLPVIFDFQAPTSRDLQETISTLAHLARFIIADISDPRSIPQELVSIVPTLPSVPVKPLIRRGEEPWGMYRSIARYPWVLGLLEYSDVAELRKAMESEIISAVEAYLAGVDSSQSV